MLQFNVSLDSIQVVNKLLERGKKILSKIESSNVDGEHLILNPLLIRMTAELIVDDEFQYTENAYKFYDAFVNKKAKVASKKGEIVIEDIEGIANKRLNYKAAHEPFALRLIFNGFIEEKIKFYFDVSLSFLEKGLKKKKKKVRNELPRYGILTVKSDVDFDFDHRTFAEFFVAEYFIYEMDDFTGLSEHEIKTKIFLLNSIFLALDFEGLSGVKKFFLDFVNSNKDDDVPPFSKNFKAAKTEIETLKNVTQNKEILSFFTFIKVAEYFVKNTKVVTLDSIFYDREWFIIVNSIEFNEILDNYQSYDNPKLNELLRSALLIKNEFL